MIRIKGLQKFFNKGKQNEIHVINDVTLDFPEKGMVAIFGRSGCGKTTLLNAIGGLTEYSSGSITIAGSDLSSSTDQTRNRYIGYVFQNYNLNGQESSYENVAAALRLCGMKDEEEINQRVTAALHNVGMEKFSKRTPDTLSGGQQQRIAIARAIVKNPMIILADEPTGNLDEANTVMIMDLLKQISKEHLVLLVTHEANLVDHYCDMVVELSDGSVKRVYHNETADGFAARDKNHVYLGEFDKWERSENGVTLEYYGSEPQKPLRVRLINTGDKLMIAVDDPSVKFVDSSSEISIREGVYKEEKHNNEISREIDMTKLPPFEGRNYGRLFGLRSAIASGYRSNFKIKGKGKNLLRRAMGLFSAVVVFMTASLGTSVGDIKKASDQYNHNVFYVTTDAATSEKLAAGLGKEDSAIDYVYVSRMMYTRDQTFGFVPGYFESFDVDYYSSSFRTNAVILSDKLIGDSRVIAGETRNLLPEEVVISQRVADKLIEGATLGYINDYSDLIGLVSATHSVNRKNLRIAGIVSGDEPAVYLSDLSIARLSFANFECIFPISDIDAELPRGKVVMVNYMSADLETHPKPGETVLIHGDRYEVSDVINYYYHYMEYLHGEGIEKIGFDEFSGTAYEYEMYYYDQLDAFFESQSVFSQDSFYFWLYNNKGISEAKYALGSHMYYLLSLYKEANSGALPDSEEEILAFAETVVGYDDFLLSFEIHYEEFRNENKGYFRDVKTSFYMNDEDYASASGHIGKSHPVVYGKIGNPDNIKVTEDGLYYVDPDTYNHYSIVHSNNPEKTLDWLASTLGLQLDDPENIDTGRIITPSVIFAQLISDYRGEIISNVITMLVITAILSICMYFIMRSSLMNRIKEIGMLRAIGVSRKNLIFRFAVEASVLSALTVLIGYLFSSVIISALIRSSTLIAEVMYYPFWMAALVLVFLFGLTVVCGILPIALLLRRSPSEILAKYDI